MLWFYLALLAALCESLKELFSKKGLAYVKPQVAAWAANVLSFPLLLGIFVLTEDIPSLGEGFAIALLCGGTLNILALIQFMRALQASDLSVTIPFITLTPVFLLVTSPLFFGEFPKPLELAGIFLIVSGAYMIHIQEMAHGYLAPFAAILNQKGPRRMLSVAMIYSITSNIDKVGVLNSSPFFWSLSINAFMVIGLLFFVWGKVNRPSSYYKPPIVFLGFVGLFHALTFLAHNFALSLAPVPSVIAVKRMSALFAVLWGYVILREVNIRERFGGALLMIAGVILIGL